VIDARWFARQNPEAAALRRRSLSRQALVLWRLRAFGAVKEQHQPRQRLVFRAVLHHWHQETCASWWCRWLEASCARRHKSWLLRSCQTAWGALASMQKSRQAAASQCLRRLSELRQEAVVQHWARVAGCRRHAGLSAGSVRSRLQPCWAALALNAALQRSSRALELRVARRRLATCLLGFSHATRTAKNARRLSARILHREGLVALRFDVLPAWRGAARARKDLRQRQLVFNRQLAIRRLSFWRNWSSNTLARRRRCRSAVETIALRTDCRKRRMLELWAAAAAAACRGRRRFATVFGRRGLALCHWAWSCWLREVRAGLMQQREELQQQLAEALAHDLELSSELQEASSRASEAELLRLRLVDELHGVSERSASLLIECQDAQLASQSLKQAVLDEQAATVRIQDEAAALKSELAGVEVRQASRRRLLEDELSRALETPALLRQKIRESEAEVVEAEVSEGQAQREAESLRNELEELNLLATQHLHEKEKEVAAMHQQVSRGRHTLHELGEALMRRQLDLRSQEVKIEELRSEDTSRYLDLVAQI
ncbi:unnamed protein product, partial [Polarella glacialis]